ncbi:hypothetical protein OAG51_01795 [Pirellulaceae bacterium]|nr:hypothetical protein [Pirellulaceae bacterium]
MKSCVVDQDFLVVLFAFLLAIPAGYVAQGQDDGITEIVSRIWTKKDGSQVTATFKSKTGDQIDVEKYDGLMASLIIDDLVQGDQDYVDEVVQKFGSAPGAHSWLDSNGKSFRGSFVRMEGTQLVFHLIDEQRRITIETMFISQNDLEYLLATLNQKHRSPIGNSPRYRAWTFKNDRNIELQSLGQYYELREETVELKQEDGRTAIALSQLSEPDLRYLVGLLPDKVDQITPFLPTSFAALNGSSQNRNDKKDNLPIIGTMGWISFGLISLLMLTLITIKYVYESSRKDWDDL